MKPHGSQILKRFQGRMGGEKRSPQVIIGTRPYEKDQTKTIKIIAGPSDKPNWHAIPTGFYTSLFED